MTCADSLEQDLAIERGADLHGQHQQTETAAPLCFPSQQSITRGLSTSNLCYGMGTVLVNGKIALIPVLFDSGSNVTLAQRRLAAGPGPRLATNANLIRGIAGDERFGDSVVVHMVFFNKKGEGFVVCLPAIAEARDKQLHMPLLVSNPALTCLGIDIRRMNTERINGARLPNVSLIAAAQRALTPGARTLQLRDIVDPQKHLRMKYTPSLRPPSEQLMSTACLTLQLPARQHAAGASAQRPL